jgi:hypothetical protein
MNLYRNKKDKRYKTYYIAKICGYGYYYESEETISGKKRKLNNSSHKLEDFYIVATK